ncbi:MAG: hypothetical protein IPL74_02780 [Bacteroidetes bacterium]|nr:hypothetical protein [Bacteroidota bacterium]
MNELVISILPAQKSRASQATQIDIWNAIKRIESNNTPQIVKARNYEKGDDYYEHVKEGSPHFIFGSILGTDKKIANIQKLTGLLYCDIDQEVIDQCGYNLLELKSAIFDRYPYMLFCNISFGGKGLGFVVYCPTLISLNAPNAYEQAYKAFASIICNDFDVKLNLDAVCFNPNRQTTLSYDTEILFRDYPLAFVFDYDGTIPYNEGKVTERDIDLSLRSNEKLVCMFQERFRDYYTSLSWIEIGTGRPVIYHEDLKFNKDEYYLSRHFNQKVLMEYDQQFRNESGTLVYIPSGIAATTLMTGKNFKVRHGSRGNFMQAFVLNYLYLLKVSGKADKIGKFYIYNLLLALNTMVYDKTGAKHTPLPVNEINILAQVIMEKFTLEDFSPSLSKKSHIRTEDCLSIITHLYKVGSKPKSIIVNEINKIRHIIQTKEIDKHISEYRASKPDCSIKELTNHLVKKVRKANGKNYEEDTIKRKVRKKVSFMDSPSSLNFGEGTKEEQKYQKDTLHRIARCVDQLIVLGEKVKKKEVIKLLSKYMCRSTVLRHWFEVKERVDAHNQSLMEGNLKLKPTKISTPVEVSRVG